jgi:LysM repeat protein
MSKNKIRLTIILLLGIVLSTACQQSYSPKPVASPTLIPPGLFVNALPTQGMQLVADLGTGTALAKTAEANGGTPVTPEAITSTPGGVIITPLSGTASVNMTNTPAPITVVPMTNTLSASTVVVPTVAGGVPATYMLQQGEFVYCIARRYNVDPNELLSANGLFDSQLIDPGLVLNMPQTGDPFPGPRALAPHPATYTVTGYNDTSLYAVACLYGDVFPNSIAQANNLPLSTVLVAGQQLQIP